MTSTSHRSWATAPVARIAHMPRARLNRAADLHLPPRNPIAGCEHTAQPQPSPGLGRCLASTAAASRADVAAPHSARDTATLLVHDLIARKRYLAHPQKEETPPATPVRVVRPRPLSFLFGSGKVASRALV